VVHEIMDRIAMLDPPERAAAIDLLMTIAGLRGLEEFVDREAKQMPILEDIRKHKIFIREYNEGLQEGQVEGERKGKSEEALRLVTRLIQHRFGPLPDDLQQRLAHASLEELEALSERVLDARSIDDLLT
jgi:predicted transposase YdaD